MKSTFVVLPIANEEDLLEEERVGEVFVVKMDYKFPVD